MLLLLSCFGGTILTQRFDYKNTKLTTVNPIIYIMDSHGEKVFEKGGWQLSCKNSHILPTNLIETYAFPPSVLFSSFLSHPPLSPSLFPPTFQLGKGIRCPQDPWDGFWKQPPHYQTSCFQTFPLFYCL